MLHFRLLLAVVLSFGAVAAAHAEIKITEARYAAGVLVVRGNVGAPGREVVLNGRVKKTSFRNGGFRFIVPVLPPDCTVHVASGGEEASAPIDACQRH
jgi:hypothetical protein